MTLVPGLAEPDETADRLVRLLLAEAEAPGPGALLVIETLARALAVHLLRFHSDVTPLPRSKTPSLPPLRIRRVIEQMRACLGEDLTLDRLAGRCDPLTSPSDELRPKSRSWAGTS